MQGTYQRMMQSRGIARVGRPLLVGLLLVLYFLLLALSCRAFFSSLSTTSSSEIPWAALRFACTQLSAIVFLVVGALTWLYVRERLVVGLLLGFCVCGILTFALATGAQSEPGSGPLTITADLAATLILPSLVLLLLHFPHNLLRGKSGPASPRWLFFAYLGVTAVLLGLTAADYLWEATWAAQPAQLAGEPGFLAFSTPLYFLVQVVCIVTIPVVSYRRAAGRERTELRLLILAAVLATVPLLCLSVLPATLFIPHYRVYAVDPEFSSLPLGLLPLTFAYLGLRRHLLVVDRTIRRAVMLAVGTLGLTLIAYLDIICCGEFLSGLLSPLIATVIMAGAAPLVWWGTRRLTDRLFSPEATAALRLLYEQADPLPLPVDPYNLPRVCEVIERTAAGALATERACLLVLDDDQCVFRPVPRPIGEGDGTLVQRRQEMAHHLVERLQPGSPGQTDWIACDAPLLAHLEGVWPALSLGDMPQAERLPARLRRLFSSLGARRQDSMLLAPVRAQGTLIGLLGLDSRENGAPFSLTDFEAIGHLLLRCSGLLQTARQFAQAQRSIEVLTAFCQVMSGELARQTTGEGGDGGIAAVVSSAAETATRALGGEAEFWLFDEGTGLLHPANPGAARLTRKPRLRIERPADEQPWFLAAPLRGEAAPADGPPCLEARPPCSLAWLPLHSGKRFHGILALLYPVAHSFSEDERRLLERFADHCAATIEMARRRQDMSARESRLRVTMQVREGQLGELASHTLLEPLQRVQAYLDLIRAGKGDRLPPRSASGGGENPARWPWDGSAPLPPFHSQAQELQALLRDLQSLQLASPSAAPLVNSRVDRDIAGILRLAERGARRVVVVASEPMAGLLTSALRVEGYVPIVLATMPQAQAWFSQRERADEPVPVGVVVDIASLSPDCAWEGAEERAARALRQSQSWSEPLPLLSLAREGPNWALWARDGRGAVVAEVPSVTISELLKWVHAWLRER